MTSRNQAVMPNVHVAVTPRHYAAYHLAAHGVIQAHMGRRVFVLDNRIQDATTRCASGEFESAQVRGDLNTAAGRMAVLRDCVYQLAGWAMNSLLTPAWPYGGFAREDEERARQILLLLDPPWKTETASIKYAKTVALKLVSDRTLFYRISRVAEVLQKRKVIGGGDVCRIIENADLNMDSCLRSRFQAARAIVYPSSPTLCPARLELPGTTPANLPKLTRKKPVPPKLSRAMPKAEEKRPVAAPSGASIEILGLQPTALAALKKRGGISTIEQLVSYSAASLLEIRTVGTKTLHEVQRALAKRGYALRRN